MYQLPIEKINQLFAAVAAEQTLYLPVDRGTKESNYEKWSKGATFSRALNTVRSAKEFFFPQTENLARFKTENRKIEIIDNRIENEDFVIFGVRACDFKSFEILDRVFLAEPIDSYYKNRREHATIITLACSKPEATCFCNALSIDATNPGGDVSAWITEKSLFLQSNTEKGEKLINSLKSLLSTGDDTEVKRQQAEAASIIEKLPFGDMNFKQFGRDKLLDLFNRKEWAELSESCLGCGTCTFVCPTCQCYDIKDFDTGHGIQRFRCWDSCMYSDFTKMAGGNPRLTQLERFRQRFMHKLVYYPENNEGIVGCVGCGRCLRKCPISMNIVKVAKALLNEN